VTDSAAEATSTTFSTGPYYALVIGNNDYTTLGKLQTAVNDAAAVAQLLENRYGFQTKLLRNATRSQILTAVAEYRRTLTETSNLLIYYAGHGYNDKEAGEAYWLPVDAQSNNNQNWISADDITRSVKAIASLHILIISDSCYSGDLTRAAFNINLGERNAFLAKMLKSKSRTLMASGGDEPVSDNGAGGHSVFAGALLQNLQQMEDAQFTAASLFERVQQQVGGRSSQVPQYELIHDSGHMWGDFVFSRGGTKRLDGTTPPPHADDLQDEVQAINDVVRRYQDAYAQLDAKVLWEIWPGAPAKMRGRIEDAFAHAAAIQMIVQARAPEIAADHDDAVVKGQFTQTLTPKGGNEKQVHQGNIVFVLKKTNGKWSIVDMPN
jgi:ketosteroid isomerase-like protein